MEKVAIIKICRNRVHDAVESAISLLGGIEKFVSPGDKVLIKPNVTAAVCPMSGAVTNYQVVKAIINLVKDARAGKIVVGESSLVGLDTMKAFHAAGYLDMAKRCGVDLIDFNKVPRTKVNIPNARVIDSITVPNVFLESDIIINVPVIKTHICVMVTLSLKNMKGVISPSAKRKLHLLGVNDGIIDINRVLKQHLIIVDGVRGQQGVGPISGEPIDMNLIITGSNPVVTDATCAKIMGINPRQVPHIVGAAEAGLGVVDFRRIKVLGEKIADVRKNFILPPRTIGDEFDGVNTYIDSAACSGCVGVISVALKRMADTGELQRVREKYGVMNIAAGSRVVSMEGNGLWITVGNCQRKSGGRARHVPGCPPTGFEVREAVIETLCRE